MELTITEAEEEDVLTINLKVPLHVAEEIKEEVVEDETITWEITNPEEFVRKLETAIYRISTEEGVEDEADLMSRDLEGFEPRMYENEL